MINKVLISENEIKEIVNKTIFNFLLKEYSADQRLPFDDDKFKNKNYFEQYLDWLEDFGKYGTLPKSKLDFWSEVKKAINSIIDNNLHGRYDIGFENLDKNDILDELKNDIIKNYLTFNNDGNLYVEREIQINGSIKDYDNSVDGKDPMQLYNSLVQNYQNNVGGCWSYRKGRAESYCSYEDGDSIILKGYIRTDDIDFIKTVLLNFTYNNEYEIRVKPNAKVELTEVICNCKYKLPLKGSLIVSATYFGNNGKYNGNYAPVDDGFGNNNYMDRKGNIKTLQELLYDGRSLDEIFDSLIPYGDKLIKAYVNDRYYILDRDGNLLKINNFNIQHSGPFLKGLAKIQIDNKWSFINEDGELIGNGKLLFDYVLDFQEDGFAKVKLSDKWSLINLNGELIGGGNAWFDYISTTDSNFFDVELNNKHSLINYNGELIGDGKLWFDWISQFDNGIAKVELNDKWSFINKNGELIKNGNFWFDDIMPLKNGLIQVEIDNKYSLLDKSLNLINNGNSWFDDIYNFQEGLTVVMENDKWNFLKEDGKLLFPNLWLDKVKPFKNGLAEVKIKDKWFLTDINGNLYNVNNKEKVLNIK